LPALNKRAVESLIKAGAFDSLGHTRKGLTAAHEAAIDAVVPLKKAAACTASNPGGQAAA
ncbi:helix-hairpin-helix domain-containing protein, partial [Streptomyces sp. NPDC002671]